MASSVCVCVLRTEEENSRDTKQWRSNFMKTTRKKNYRPKNYARTDVCNMSVSCSVHTDYHLTPFIYRRRENRAKIAATAELCTLHDCRFACDYLIFPLPFGRFIFDVFSGICRQSPQTNRFCCRWPPAHSATIVPYQYIRPLDMKFDWKYITFTALNESFTVVSDYNDDGIWQKA